MVYGYLRVSTGKQNLSNQESEILRYAAAKGMTVDGWVRETVSGCLRDKERKLGRLLGRLRAGDALIVTELSRLSRTLSGIMSIVGRCLERRVHVYSTKDGYCFDDTINSKVLCFAFGLVAEIERNLISMRTREALAVRRSQGVVLGRRKGSCTKLNRLVADRGRVLCRLRRGESIGAICRQYGVSRTTFARFRRADPGIGRILEERPQRATRRRPLPSAEDEQPGR